MSREARERLQLERLGETIAWAVARVPFHRDRLSGVTVRGLPDLVELPFVHKSDLREHYPFGLLAVDRKEVARVHASSGTRGKPTVAAYTTSDLDVWREGMREALERAFGFRAFDTYGLSEIIGPGVAGECEERAGLHIADDHFLPEIVDPATGASLPPGTEGELTLTTLTKRAAPLIRYRT